MIENNSCLSDHTQGGGVDADYSRVTISNCIVRGNRSYRGGGIAESASTLSLSRCRIVGNTADEDGGGIYLTGDSSTLTNCVVGENRVEAGLAFGAGIAAWNDYTTIQNCIIRNNIAPALGSAGGGLNVFCTLEMTNSTVVGNNASEGGAIYTYADAILVHSSILWDNGLFPIVSETGPFDPVVTYSDVQYGWPGIGNVSGNPKFFTRAGYDFLLAPSSPCIDTGYQYGEDSIDWSSYHPGYGLKNTPAVDMGAYGGRLGEYWLP